METALVIVVARSRQILQAVFGRLLKGRVNGSPQSLRWALLQTRLCNHIWIIDRGQSRPNLSPRPLIYIAQKNVAGIGSDFSASPEIQTASLSKAAVVVTVVTPLI